MIPLWTIDKHMVGKFEIGGTGYTVYVISDDPGLKPCFHVIESDSYKKKDGKLWK